MLRASAARASTARRDAANARHRSRSRRCKLRPSPRVTSTVREWRPSSLCEAWLPSFLGCSTHVPSPAAAHAPATTRSGALAHVPAPTCSCRPSKEFMHMWRRVINRNYYPVHHVATCMGFEAQLKRSNTSIHHTAAATAGECKHRNHGGVHCKDTSERACPRAHALGHNGTPRPNPTSSSSSCTLS